MPELPEVELTRRHLATAVAGRRLRDVVVSHDRTARRNMRRRHVADRLEGRRIHRWSRRGKYLFAEVEGHLTLLAHLWMSGRFSVSKEPPPPHTHFRASIEGTGANVYFIDPRTFGFVAVLTPEELGSDPVSRLGRDALDDLPSSEELEARLRRRTAPIKAILLDQSLVAGLGNIYVDEILHAARIHPLRTGSSLRSDELAALHAAVGPVLGGALAGGGTTLDDMAYLLPDGRAGEYMMRLAAYDRTGEPCPVCRTPIDRIMIRGRSSHFCAVCQPAADRR